MALIRRVVRLAGRPVLLLLFNAAFLPDVESAAASTIAGQIRYFGSGLPVSGVTLQLLGSNIAFVQTDGNGKYAFTNVGPGDWRVEPQKFGDAHGALTALDAVWALQAVVGLRTIDSYNRVACDTDGTGFLSAVDAVFILQYKVGLINMLPSTETCGSEWAFDPVPFPVTNQQIDRPQAMPAGCRHGDIAYRPLVEDVDNQDFLAILVGDCNGSWQGVPATPTLTVSASPSPTPTFGPVCLTSTTVAFFDPIQMGGDSISSNRIEDGLAAAAKITRGVLIQGYYGQHTAPREARLRGFEVAANASLNGTENDATELGLLAQDTNTGVVQFPMVGGSNAITDQHLSESYIGTQLATFRRLIAANTLVGMSERASTMLDTTHLSFFGATATTSPDVLVASILPQISGVISPVAGRDAVFSTINQLRQAYPTKPQYYLVGWSTTGSSVTEQSSFVRLVLAAQSELKSQGNLVDIWWYNNEDEQWLTAYSRILGGFGFEFESDFSTKDPSLFSSACLQTAPFSPPTVTPIMSPLRTTTQAAPQTTSGPSTSTPILTATGVFTHNIMGPTPSATPSPTSIPTPPDLTWTSRGDGLAGGQVETSVMWGDNLYAFGLGSPTSLYILNTVSNVWREGTPTLQQVNTGSAAAWNGEIFVLSGYGEQRLQVYTAATGRWRLAAQLPASHLGYPGTMLIAFGAKVYAFGGILTDQLSIYDIATDSWSAGHAMPMARSLAVTAVLRDKLYLVGGQTSFGLSSQVVVYDPASEGYTVADNSTGDWTTLDGLVVTRRTASIGVVADDQIFVLGGLEFSQGFGQATAMVESYDPSAPPWTRWRRHAPLLRSRAHLAGGSIGNKLYVAAGQDLASDISSTEEGTLIYVPTATPTPLPSQTPTPTPTVFYLNLIVTDTYLVNVATGKRVDSPLLGQQVRPCVEWFAEGPSSSSIDHDVATWYDSVPNEVPAARVSDQGGNYNSYCRGDGFVVTAGFHTASVDIDPRNEVPEPADQDNVGSISWLSWTGPSPTPTIPLPVTPYNLVVDEVWVEDLAGARVSSPGVGDTIRVAARWHVEGSGVASFTIRASVSGHILDDVTNYVAAANQSFTMRTSLTHVILTDGPITASWELDPQNARNEPNEDDNSRQFTWIARDDGPADIAVARVIVSDAASPDASLNTSNSLGPEGLLAERVSGDLSNSSAASSPVRVTPLLSDSVVLDTALTAVRLPRGGTITLTAYLRPTGTPELNCGTQTISTDQVTTGTVYLSVVCDTTFANPNVSYLPLVKATVSNFTDIDPTNNETAGDKLITPQSRPGGNVRFSSSFLPLKDVTLYTLAGVQIGGPRTALADGRVFTTIDNGSYLVGVTTMIGTPLYDNSATGSPAYFLDVAPTGNTAVSFDDATPQSCPLGRCAKLTVGGEATVISGLEGMKRRVLWEAAYAMNGCQNNGGNPRTGCVTATTPYKDNIVGNTTYATFSYLASDETAAKAAFSDDALHGTCYNHSYPPISTYDCSVQHDPVTEVLQYSRHPGRDSEGVYSRGGQCKKFVALVLYRSGIRHTVAGSFSRLPEDAKISNDLVMFPVVAIPHPGDILRRPNGHALIVAASIAGLGLIAVDSNYSGGDGHERIAVHLMGPASLVEYHNLNCVYTGAC